MTRRAEDWTVVLDASEIADGEMTTVKRGKHQLVVGRSGAGGLFALDNRCPHEGYPLAQGDLKDGALTCCWHNWKFETGSGRCTIGGEDVRAYPVREEGGRIAVDLADPDPAEQIPALRGSLEDGMHRHDNGWALRAAVRLLEAGHPAEHLAADVAAWDARVAEYGTTHALPVLADGLRLAERFSGTEALHALAPGIDMAGDANRRMPARELAPSLDVDLETVGDELRAAVEAEDSGRAEGLFRGALEAGATREQRDLWLYRVASDHFLSFGHALIYLVKSQELADRAGDHRAGEVQLGLLWRIVHGTREDTLPYLAGFRERLLAREPELPRLHGGRGPVADPGALRERVLHGKPGDAFDALWNELEGGAHPRAVARVLVVAAAERFLAFDDALDRDPTVAEGWLFATHRFTFASAVRNALERFDEPDALRLLVWLVGFVNTGKPMDLASRPSIGAVEATVTDVVEAVEARDPWAAVRAARGVLASGEGAELQRRLEDLCLADPLVRPIVVAHALKTTVAAFEERQALALDPATRADADLPVLAAVRLLASPIVERRVQQTVRTSIDWVRDGVMPRKLTQ